MCSVLINFSVLILLFLWDYETNFLQADKIGIAYLLNDHSRQEKVNQAAVLPYRIYIVYVCILY